MGEYDSNFVDQIITKEDVINCSNNEDTTSIRWYGDKMAMSSSTLLLIYALFIAIKVTPIEQD